MCIARIARPGAFYCDAVSARTSETVDWPILNSSDFDDIADVNLAIATNDGIIHICLVLRNTNGNSERMRIVRIY